MRGVLLLRLDAPLMSFGGVVVDQRGVTRDFPSRSMVAGLLGNALGLHHGEMERLSRLQARLLLAARRDRAGQALTDFQTVDLGQAHLQHGWTTRGVVESRGGGSARTSTHIRYRDYLADAVYTVAVALEPADEEPRLGVLEQALREPRRPLFLGRKACLPAAPLLLGRIEAADLVAALRAAPPLPEGRADPGELRAWWPAGKGGGNPHTFPVTDERDWANQIHTGRRWIAEGRLELEGDHHG